MAEVTAFRNNALPYPVYGVPWAVTFPMLDADGDLVTGATTPDAEVSKNGDTFADCTNESVEIATTSGVYYLLLTGAEMTADIVTVIAKSATVGMKTTVLTFYPRKLVSLRAATAAGGAAGSITLDASASAVDDFYNACLVVGVLDSATEARIITDYTGSTKVAAVTPNWNTTPDSDDTFTVYLPEGRQINQANVTHVAETAQTARDIGASVLLSNGTGTGQVKLASGYAAITWADIAAPTTTVNLSGTTMKTATDVATAIAALNNISAAQVNSECDIALADVGLTTTVTGRVDAAVSTRATPAQVNTEADTALSDVGLTTTITGRIDAAVTTRATPAQVNTEVLDCLVTDTHAQPSAVPAATSSLKDKINWLYTLARNKLTQTSTTQTLYADDASTPVGTSAVADDLTTASRAEWS